MNKADLIEAVAIKCDISKLAAQRAVDAMIGRNLRTNKSIDIPARKVPKFVAGKNLKDVVE